MPFPRSSFDTPVGPKKSRRVHSYAANPIDRKAAALACHASQREWLRAQHGMDNYIESMKTWAARRGADCGTAYAEAFFLHKGHPHPQNDVLCEILGGKTAV